MIFYGRRKKEEGRRKKEEGRRKREEGRGKLGHFVGAGSPKYLIQTKDSENPPRSVGGRVYGYLNWEQLYLGEPAPTALTTLATAIHENYLTPYSLFLLPSSFFPIPSSLFLLPSSFFLLPSSFFLRLKSQIS